MATAGCHATVHKHVELNNSVTATQGGLRKEVEHQGK